MGLPGIEQALETHDTGSSGSWDNLFLDFVRPILCVSDVKSLSLWILPPLLSEHFLPTGVRQICSDAAVHLFLPSVLWEVPTFSFWDLLHIVSQQEIFLFERLHLLREESSMPVDRLSTPLSDALRRNSVSEEQTEVSLLLVLAPSGTHQK